MGKNTKKELVQQLVDAYHTLLDEALIVAIASDHDLLNPSEFEAAKTTLNGLSQNVPEEEASGFNPSGFLGFVDDSSRDTKDSLTNTTRSGQETQSQKQTTDSSSTASLNASDPMGQNQSAPELTVFNNDSEDGKVQELQIMFPDLKRYDVAYALKKSNWDFQAALDDLLNVQYLQATGQQTKGIDGFFRDDSAPKTKRKGRKGKKSQTQNEDALLAAYMKEAKEQSEIGHLSERFNLTFDEVAEIYYDKGHSSSAAAVGILDQYLSQNPATPDDDIALVQISILSRKYRQIPEKYLKCIVSVTNNIEHFSDEIAALVNKHFSKRQKGQKMSISNRLTPLPHQEIEGSTSAPSSPKPSSSSSTLPILPPAGPSRTTDFAQATQLSDALHQAKRDAITSAAQMYKKGSSNPLYRQAAGYYAERARDNARFAQGATSSAADLLVDQQSSPYQIDLHGVTVQEGVRIARQRALNWWEGLGDAKSRKARERSLTIITGVGRHSAGGVSQLRRSVAAALLQDGWKVEIGTGKFTLTGRR